MTDERLMDIAIREALRQMTPKFRSVLVASLVGCPNEQIAKELRFSVASVRRWKAYSLKEFREFTGLGIKELEDFLRHARVMELYDFGGALSDMVLERKGYSLDSLSNPDIMV